MKYNDEQKLVSEEQWILDELIEKMDERLLQINRRLTKADLELKKSNVKVLADAYGAFLSTKDEQYTLELKRKNIRRSRNELYDTRLELHYQDLDEYGRFGDQEIKVGLHTLQSGADIYIMSWTRPLCRHFIMDNEATEFESRVENPRTGEVSLTHFDLQLKRKITLSFDTVIDVFQQFPELEEAEKIIADEFLQELLKRRSEKEFKNIVFSIQKQQGEIIQKPLSQNIIIQGCAGSGKSMIMLHRLPILLFDNPHDVTRTNMYIITPSTSYIQLAEQLLYDLEIQDLPMGTIHQYYDYALSKYGLNSALYGRIDPTKKLSAIKEKEVYSAYFIDKIESTMNQLIYDKYVDMSIGLTCFQLEETITRTDTYQGKLRKRILTLQSIINANDNSISVYYKGLKDLLNSYDALAISIQKNRTTKKRQIAGEIIGFQENIHKLEAEIEALDPSKNDRAIKTRQKFIEIAQERIHQLNEEFDIISNDNTYDEFERIATEIRAYIKTFPLSDDPDESLKRYSNTFALQSARENFLKSQYNLLAAKQEISNLYVHIMNKFDAIIDPIDFYSLPEMRTLKKAWEELSAIELPYLDYEYYMSLKETVDYCNKISGSIVQQTYQSLMSYLGYPANEKGSITGLTCSPYIYLQCVYKFYGAAPKLQERLITIDEAQNMAPEELKLIHNINSKKLILNLFGDTKQHIENSKGIDNWQEIMSLAKFEIHRINENYRNAKQITNYCNNRFSMHMRAINLDGTGVKEFVTANQFTTGVTSLLQQPPRNGKSCLIVKTKEEAAFVLKSFSSYASRFNDMTNMNNELKNLKWNVMTIDQVKGLEFPCVIAISGRMSQNEKYIAYTRALDELYVFDSILDIFILPQTNIANHTIYKTETTNTQKKKRKKRSTTGNISYVTPVQKTNSARGTNRISNTPHSNKQKIHDSDPVQQLPLKEFFKKRGCQVVDKREKNGCLWIIGDESQIGHIVNVAVQRYHISGAYSSGKATNYKRGWYTKSDL